MTFTTGTEVANDFYIAPQTNLRNLAVDLDGTLAWPTWKPSQQRSVIGDPIPENIAKLEEALAAGFDYEIHTARPWTDREMILEWVKYNRLPEPTAVVCGKLLAHKYIDDKAINARDERWY